uniref:Uncharacterized protein n=1 Tax=Arundo donax TaxID=35708 RepID=A0A0A8XT79_ARUDO
MESGARRRPGGRQARQGLWTQARRARWPWRGQRAPWRWRVGATTVLTRATTAAVREIGGCMAAGGSGAACERCGVPGHGVARHQHAHRGRYVGVRGQRGGAGGGGALPDLPRHHGAQLRRALPDLPRHHGAQLRLAGQFLVLGSNS